MSKRPPSPIRVTNPASANHIVRLHPAQDAVVTFDSKESNNIVMKSDSDFITTITDSSTYFKFGQRFDFSEFTKNSKLYLGNISFDKGDSTPIVNLSVILESQEEDKDKDNKVTVVNPRDCQLKVNAGDIIEVVICEPTITDLTWNIIGGEKELEYTRDFGLTIKDGTNIYSYHAGNPVTPFCVSTKKSKALIPLDRYTGAVKEHHLWFKLTPESIEKSKELTSGSYNAGKIVFMVPKVGAVYQIDFLLDVREKKRKKEKKTAKKILLAGSNNSQKRKTKNKSKNKGLVRSVVSKVYEPYKPQSVSITQKLQPVLDGDGCHWEWHHEFKLKKNNTTTNVVFRRYKNKQSWPANAWEDEEGFIRGERGDVIGYSANYYLKKDDCLGIYD